MCAAIRWERPSAGVSGDHRHVAALLHTAREALLNTSPETIVATTLKLPLGQLTSGRSGRLMDQALDLAAANGLIAEVADRANHVDVRLTRQYRALKGGRR